MPYKNICFFQGEEADEAFRVLDRMGEWEAISYLTQWEYEDKYSEWNNESVAGSDDRTATAPAGEPGRTYVLSYCLRLDYIGLQLFLEE